MSFRRFSEFAENKTKSLVVPTVSLQQYNENLLYKFSGAVIKKRNESVDALRQASLYKNLQQMLDDIDFPYAESLMISVSAHNQKKFDENLVRLQNFLTQKNLKTNLVGMFEQVFLNNQTKQHIVKLDPTDVDKIIENLQLDAANFIDTCKAKIEIIISEIDWSNHPIHVEAIVGEDNFCTKAKVFLGDHFVSSFELEKTNDGLQVTNESIDELPSSSHKQFTDLIDKIRDNFKSKNIMTLYWNCPRDVRESLKEKRRTLAVGETHFLPRSSHLTNMLWYKNQDDVWKVKIFKEHLSTTLLEGDSITYRTTDNCKILHLELVKEASYEE